MSETVKLTLDENSLDENDNILFLGERVFARYRKKGEIRVPVGNVKTATLIYVMNSEPGEHVLFRAQALNGENFLIDHEKRPYKKATIAMGLEYGDLSKDAKFRPLCEELAKHDGKYALIRALKDGVEISVSPESDDESLYGDSGGSDAAVEDKPTKSGADGSRSEAESSSSHSVGGGSVTTAVEGVPYERMARSVTRSPQLRKRKLAECWDANDGKLICELCGNEGAEYPGECRDRLFEVHHIKPVSEGEAVNSTTGLAVLCANCHRTVHASADVENNFRALELHFVARRKGRG